MSIDYATGELVSVTDYNVHPVADIFPLIEGAAFRELVEDIRQNGQRVPVVLDKSGRLLDGRNRVRACRALGVEVQETTYSGEDVEAWIVSHNVHRRHLTESQRAMVAAKLANLRNGLRKDNAPPSSIDEGGATSRADAAAALNVSPASVDRARVVQKHGTPELNKAVETGEITVNKAADIIKAADRDPAKVADVHERVKAGKPLPKPKPKRPGQPSTYGPRRKHRQVLDAMNASLSGLAIAATEIAELDSSVTREEAARLASDLSESITALRRLNNLLKERTA